MKKNPQAQAPCTCCSASASSFPLETIALARVCIVMLVHAASPAMTRSLGDGGKEEVEQSESWSGGIWATSSTSLPVNIIPSSCQYGDVRRISSAVLSQGDILDVVV
jgi:hypothetical protein